LERTILLTPVYPQKVRDRFVGSVASVLKSPLLELPAILLRVKELTRASEYRRPSGFEACLKLCQVYQPAFDCDSSDVRGASALESAVGWMRRAGAEKCKSCAFGDRSKCQPILLG